MEQIIDNIIVLTYDQADLITVKAFLTVQFPFQVNLQLTKPIQSQLFGKA